jgi:hypothetical protein
MEGGVCLDKSILKDEQLKDPANMEAFCWSGKEKGLTGRVFCHLDWTKRL